MYPSLVDNPDYTAVINERHYGRLQRYLDEAKAEGVRLVQINPPGESFELQNVHRMPPTLVIKPRKDSLIMEEEIFGPVLAVLTYQRIDEAIDFVNSRPRPLGFYYFGEDEAEERQVLDKTVSGGVTVNDLMGHVNCESMPFGGVGASGMGAYHGLTGFRTFSHARAIYRQAHAPEAALLFRPPFSETVHQILANGISRWGARTQRGPFPWFQFVAVRMVGRHTTMLIGAPSAERSRSVRR